MYLGCDWENVPLHLPSHLHRVEGVGDNPNVRMALLDHYGLTWPWESLHVEALAWFDHWLKGHDTGIMDGAADPLRRCPGADDWRTAEQLAARAAPSHQRVRAARRRRARPSTRARPGASTT